jgi:hypothetical protein
MSLLDGVKNRALTRGQSLSRRMRMRTDGVPTTSEPIRLVSSAGYQIEARVHRPRAGGRWPAVLLCPGTDDPGGVFEGWTQPINAAEVASMGLVVMHFDPAGRGRSWGEEDYGGLEHQDNVRVCLRHLAGLEGVDPDHIGVVAISLGIAMACGGLARADDTVRVDWLIDWEGPCDREIICAGGRIMAPALGHTLDDEVYWRPREAVRWVGELPCGYLRIQSSRDHAQPGEIRHAARMMQAAATGRLPWFRLNDHEPGLVPRSPRLYAPGRSQANKALLRWIRTLSD